MKKIYLLTKVCFFAAMMFMAAACTEDDAAVSPIFPEGETVETVVPGTEYTLTFSANLNWELESSKPWCKFSNGFQSVKGEAGENISQKIIVTTDGMTLQDDIAEITLIMGGEEKIIAKYTREGLVPAVTDFNNNVYGEENPLSFEYTNNGVKSIKGFIANFSWRLSDSDLPEWIKIEDGSEIGGNPGDKVQVSFYVPEEFWLAAQEGNIKIKNEEIGCEVIIPVTFDGMPEGIINVKGISSAWNWIVSQDGTKYWQKSQGSTEGETQEYNFPLTLNVLAKNNEYVVKCLYDDNGWMTSVNPGSGVSDEEFYFYNVEDNKKGTVTIDGFSELNGTKRRGYVIIMPTSKYNELSNNGTWNDDNVLVTNGDVSDDVVNYVVMSFEQEAPAVEAKVEMEVYSVNQGIETPVVVEFANDRNEAQVILEKINSGEIWVMDPTQVYITTVPYNTQLNIYPLLKDAWGELLFQSCTFADLQGVTLEKQPEYTIEGSDDLSKYYLNITCKQSVVAFLKDESLACRKILIITIENQ